MGGIPKTQLTVGKALEIAKDNQNGQVPPAVTTMLERSISDIWRRIQAQPASYVMTKDQFAVFTYYRGRYDITKVIHPPSMELGRPRPAPPQPLYRLLVAGHQLADKSFQAPAAIVFGLLIHSDTLPTSSTPFSIATPSPWDATKPAARPHPLKVSAGPYIRPPLYLSWLAATIVAPSLGGRNVHNAPRISR